MRWGCFLAEDPCIRYSATYLVLDAVLILGIIFFDSFCYTSRGHGPKGKSNLLMSIKALKNILKNHIHLKKGYSKKCHFCLVVVFMISGNFFPHVNKMLRPWLLLLGPQGKNLNYILGIQLKGANFFTVEAHSLTDDL